MGIWLKIIIAILLLSVGVWSGINFSKNTYRPETTRSGTLLLENLPIMEVASREIKWQVTIHHKETFPAREYVASKVVTIKAGFDISQMDPGENMKFDSNSHTVTIQLPPPQILSVSWGKTEIFFEKHSLASAAFTKSNADENRRRKLFNQALLNDIRNHNILSEDTMTAGLKNLLTPFFSAQNLSVIYKAEWDITFQESMENYLRKNETQTP